jgi:hypothetical protein
MDSHKFVPAPPKFRIRRKPRKIIRTTREVGAIVDKPDLESMTFVQQLKAMGLAGSRTSLSINEFRDRVGQLARRHRDATMGINGKYLLHALDAGDIEDCAAEIFGIDPTGTKVAIDPELTSIALEEAFEKISEAARSGAKIIFASSRPAATMPLFIELARLSASVGAEVLDSFDNSSPFIADGRKGRMLTWCSGVAVVSDGSSLLATDDAVAAEDLLFHLPRPDLVVADHIFAGAALTNGFPTVAFAGLNSLAVAVASLPEKHCLAVPISLDQSCTRYGIIANNAKSYFE